VFVANRKNARAIKRPSLTAKKNSFFSKKKALVGLASAVSA